MKPDLKHLDYAGERLRLVGSRVARPGQTGGGGGGGGHHDGSAAGLRDEKALPGYGPSVSAPIFIRNHAASNFELFYDLWFVANLNVFAGVHSISSEQKLVTFIGFYTLLWTTWLVTTIYDVRFTSDSILERACKALHLGVMVGFAEMGTSFDPHKQIESVYRAMSLFLCVSRLLLTVQYGVVAYQVRKYAHGLGPMVVTVVLHFVAACIYFGISFRYSQDRNSRIYIAWYVMGLVEMALHLGFSQLSDVLTFLGTHLGERLNLLTLIVMGEGVIILAKNITLVVKDTYLKDPTIKFWSPALIGNIAAATALIYIIFQLYFDWMHGEDESMSKRHQVWWASLHLPFHIALVLLVEGANKLFIWWRVRESAATAAELLNNLVDQGDTSDDVAKKLWKTVKKYLEKAPPKDVLEAYQGVNGTITRVKEIPDSFWAVSPLPEAESKLVGWTDDFQDLLSVIYRSIYSSFHFEGNDKSAEETAHDQHSSWQDFEAHEGIDLRFRLVFIYVYVCAGVVLLFLTVMHIISKQRGWSPFNVFRTGVCVAVAVGLALTAAVVHEPRLSAGYLASAWVLPTITLSYFVVLVLTHLPHPDFGLGRFRKGAYTELGGRGDPECDARKDAAVAVRETGEGGPRYGDGADGAAAASTETLVTAPPGHGSPRLVGPPLTHGPVHNAPLIPLRLGSRSQRK